MSDLFLNGAFVSHSGLNLDYKIECDNLSHQEIELFAKLIAAKVKFNTVIGIKSGGNRLAQALLPYCTKEENLPVLIVDDVLTTGNSMKEARKEIMELGLPIIGFVIFARGPLPDWCRAFFITEEALRN